MEHRELGRSGLEISRVILGCGNFGGVGSAPELVGRGDTEEQAFALMDHARTLGIGVFDTADAYGGGASEAIIGHWLAARDGTRPLLSTKTFNAMEPGGDQGLSRPRILRQIDTSLDRLGVDRVDMYLTHEWDAETPIDETLGALDELVRAGTVRAVGASNVTADRLETALRVSEERGLVRFEWVQNEYSLLDRRSEDVLRVCAEHGLGFTPFSPLAGGWLTGKYRRGQVPPSGSRMSLRPDPYVRFQNDRTFGAIERFLDAAEARGVHPAALAVAWALGDERVSGVVIGPRRPQQLDDVLPVALELGLDEGERADLAALFD